jgi:murein DD-endopeptidase MepM/ murein hydrolase activator NlpD
LYRITEVRGGSAGAAAALRFGADTFAPGPVFGHRADPPRRRIGDFDLVVDLGQRIGSGEWFRGLITCIALCYAAWSLAPPLAPLAGAGDPPLGDTQFEQMRALEIAPLAYGGDTGRRMAPTEAVVPLPEAPERPIIDLAATLGRGDGFQSALQRAGVGGAEAAEVAAMIGAVVPADDIRPGTVMDLTLGRRPNRMVARPLERLSLRARFDLRIEVARVAGALHLTQIPIAVDETPLRIQGRVGASLYRSARAAGVPARIVESYLRALATQISVPSGIDADDRFDIIIEHRRAATGETETGQLLYAGLRRERGRDLQLMQWTSGGATQWFEASGVGRRSGGLLRPVPGRITSPYGRRYHPILHYTRMHTGTDFHAAYGQPIVAVADGRVTRAGRAGGYGNQVMLSHGGGLVTSYSHMSRFAVHAGQTVHRGQVIGYVGSTGLATGPHLHYEVFRHGARVDPMSVRFSTRAQLAGDDLAGFRSRLRGLLATPLASQRAEATADAGDRRAAP